MPTNPEHPLAFIGSIHGNEILGAAVHVDNQRQSRPGLVSTLGHPDALAAGERYLGDEGELGGLIPPDAEIAKRDLFSANPDRRAAAELYLWLDRVNPWLAISSHCTKAGKPGSEYISVGPRVMPAQLAVAHVVEFRQVFVNPDYPLLVNRPKVVETEHIMPGDVVSEDMLDKWRDYIAKIYELGPEGMAKLFQSGPPLQYFQHAGYVWLVVEGKPNEVVLDMLEELETAVDTIERFAPLPLDDAIKRRLGVASLELFISSWDHQHMARPAPQFGRSKRSGVVRREVLGGYFIKTEPQLAADGTLEFAAVPSNALA